ncbi:hypothetical protein KQ310_02390 [Synechococcus sp. CS-1328]|nr:hypothetical protein [Synechococcus sp. CS-1328]
MQESNCVYATTSTEDPILSDLPRVDPHEILPEEYVEIPEITEADLARAVIKGPRTLDQP